MSRVFVTGATGYIGRAICRALVVRGDSVVALSRDGARAARALGGGIEVVEGDPTAAGPWQAAVSGCDAVINLAGEPIDGKRWNAQFRQRLLDSRIDATRCLVEVIGAAAPKVLVSASGVDYYAFDAEILGVQLDDDDEDDADVFDEASPGGDGFLARMCRDWEDEARGAAEHGVRVVCMRTGIVIDAESHALRKMAAPFKMMAGGRVGHGRQWFAWIHRDDAVGAYLFAVDEASLSGPVNLVAGSVRQREFSRALGVALHRRSWLPVPKFAVKAAVGPLAEYLLNGRHVVPAALRKAGYAFRYAELSDALAEIYPR